MLLIIIVLIFSHVLMFALGWWFSVKAIQAYIVHEIMRGTTPFLGEELKRLKKFVRYKERE